MNGSTTVGIIANPASARDIRRLVAEGAPVTTNDKIGILKRVLVGLGSVGVERVLSMTDLSGISGGLQALADRLSARGWPSLDFVDHEITETPLDTVVATRAMARAGVGAIVVLGGDGTNRLVAAGCGDIPMVSISTGTNNTFPRFVEPTVAGMAAGLVATGKVHAGDVTARAKYLLVSSGEVSEWALVDVAVTDMDFVASGAVWDPAGVSELYLCFAEPGAIGLSSIGANLNPVSRSAPWGMYLKLGPPAALTVTAPVGPGLVRQVAVASHELIEAGGSRAIGPGGGVIAIDGERMIRPEPGQETTVTLMAGGPRVVDVGATMARAAETGVLVGPPPRSPGAHDP